MTTRIVLLSTDVFDIGIADVAVPDLRETIASNDSPFFQGVASVAGVKAGFSWDDGLVWDSLETIGFNADGDAIYLLEGVLQMPQAVLLYVEQILTTALSLRMSRAIKRAEDFWAEQWSNDV